MKKYYKYIVSLVIIIATLFILSNKANANTIKSIEMEVYIEANGTARITEVWAATLNQGTEGYKPYGNMGTYEITNFKVKDETGRNYETLSKWNINASFNEKAYKCGINEENGKIELCWGISNYGSKKYTLTYNIENFVKQYKDSQGIYFSLMPKSMEQKPNSVKITIKSANKFSTENSKIWAFGYPNGTINFSNGTIVMDSNGQLSSDNYMVALVQIENGTFSTSSEVNKTFDDIYKDAMKGVDLAEKSFSNIIFTILAFILSSAMPIIAIIVVCLCILLPILKKDGYEHEEKFEGNADKELKIDKVEYFREIPCEGNLYLAYWIIGKYDLMYKDESKIGLIGAILLKWIKEGNVTIEKTKEGKFNFSEGEYAIDFRNKTSCDNEFDKELLRMLKKASGSNGILEPKEFTNWCKTNYRFVNEWFRIIDKNLNEEMRQKKLITRDVVEKKSKFGGMSIVVTDTISSQLSNKAKELLGLKKFLLEYSLIQEKEAIEVKLWEDYLVFAQLLGIADKVQKQFKELYPEAIEKFVVNNVDITICIRQMAYIGINETQKQTMRQQRESMRSDDYSSGSGGSSFSGGGTSSGGFSSGGGFR